MVFWIAILAGVLFVWLAVRLGFYEMWVLLFNVVISIYVAILLAPVFADLASAAGGTASYGTALSLLVLAGGCFAALHGLSYVFLTSQFNIPFPRFFDILLSGLLGFAAGFLILSFAALIITTTPLAGHRLVSSIGFNPRSQQANITCVAWCCDRVHSITGFDAGTTRSAIDRLLTRRPDPASDANQREPNSPAASTWGRRSNVGVQAAATVCPTRASVIQSVLPPPIVNHPSSFIHPVFAPLCRPHAIPANTLFFC